MGEKDERQQVCVVKSEDAGKRLDAFLSNYLPSRSLAQKLIQLGRVEIGGLVTTKASRSVTEGDKVTVTHLPPEPAEAKPEEIPIEVIYEDNHLIVINKQKGLVVHPAPGNRTGTLVNALLSHCQGELSGIGGVMRPGIVHRLDKDTSGVMVVAKSDTAHRSLAAQIKRREVSRVYVALVHGHPPAKGSVDAPIARHPVHRKRMAVQTHGRPAVTHFRVLEELGPYSLITAKLETGRTHQIRVHMAHIGYPVAGDSVYGPRQVALAADGQLLHAWRLSFLHPVLRVGVTFVAPLPEPFVKILGGLREKGLD